jgi:hypothetical protein
MAPELNSALLRKEIIEEAPQPQVQQQQQLQQP